MRGPRTTMLAVICTALLTASCSGMNGPSDRAIGDFLRAEHNKGTWGSTRCADHFEIVGVRIVDKKVEGNRAVVIATTSVRSKNDVNGMAGVAMCQGAQSWQAGEVRQRQARIVLERWQSGWRAVSIDS